MATFLRAPQILLVQTKTRRHCPEAEIHRSPCQLRDAESLCEIHQVELTFEVLIEAWLGILAQLLGVVLAPVNILNVGNEPLAIVAFGKVPLIEPKIIIGFHPPMGHPLADVRVRIDAFAYAIFGVALKALAVAGAEVLPAPAVRVV